MIEMHNEDVKPGDLIKATAKDLSLEVSFEFVPWSRSRNKDNKDPSLNYKVTLSKGGRTILTTDYGMGYGHSPSYKSLRTVRGGYTLHDYGIVKAECETGFVHKNMSFGPMKTKRKIEPDAADVINSLVLDSDVLDYSSFEDWALELGFDPDSRSGEKVYQACMAIALKLRNAIGDEGLTRLREAGQDY